VKTPYSRRTVTLLAAVAVSAGALITTGALALPASAGQPSVKTTPLNVRQIAFGKKLHHVFRPGGTGVPRSEPLTGPDDLTMFDRHIFVGFQNGVGAQGEPSTDGNLDSTVVEFTLAGKEVRQWDLRGKCDGLTADIFIGGLIATVNEDAKSSLYTIRIPGGAVRHFNYNVPLAHKGGTDAISIFHSLILVSASAPGTSGKLPAKPPAVYLVLLHPTKPIAFVHPWFFDNSVAKAANGPHAGKLVKLALTDPDSSEIVAPESPRFRNDYMLNSQGDQELIFFNLISPTLQVLSLPTSVDDTAWATGRRGLLYATDSSADTLDIVSGVFSMGTAYTAVTPCNANSAPATCPGPGFPPNYLGTINLTTGAIAKVATTGAALQPKGLLFVPAFLPA
jgi:hypothetical protein